MYKYNPFYFEKKTNLSIFISTTLDTLKTCFFNNEMSCTFRKIWKNCIQISKSPYVLHA